VLDWVGRLEGKGWHYSNEGQKTEEKKNQQQSVKVKGFGDRKGNTNRVRLTKKRKRPMRENARKNAGSMRAIPGINIFLGHL